MLVSIIERLSPITHRKSIVYSLKCDACDALIEDSKCRFERSKYHCCNSKCVSRHRREHPELYPDNSAFRITSKAIAKAKATRQRKIDEGTYVHPWTGRKHSEETKRHLSEVSKGGIRSGKNNGMFGRGHTEETRAKMSESKTKLILEGKFHAYGTHNKKGCYTSTKTGQECFFRSSWEEALMKHLDLDPSVRTWAYESFRIPYFYSKEGVQRWYVPDFLVTRTDGTRQLIEVKPREFIDGERVKLKSQAGEHWCLENGAVYLIVTKQILKEWGILV